MALEWLPNVATAFVGMAGIAATFLTQDRVRKHQNDVALQQDDRRSLFELQKTKQATYAKLVGSLRAAVQYVWAERLSKTAIQQFLNWEPDDEVRQVAIQVAREQLKGKVPDAEIDTILENFERKSLANVFASIKKNRETTAEAARIAVLKDLGYDVTGLHDRVPTDKLHADAAEVIFLSANSLKGSVTAAVAAAAAYAAAQSEDAGDCYAAALSAMDQMQENMLEDIRNPVA